MVIYNANYWEDYNCYISKRNNQPKAAVKKKLSKKQREEKRKAYNSMIKGVAERFAEDMQKEPSALEKKMQEFLERFGVEYQFQKPLYIRKRNKSIRKFYIADFYIPAKNLIIETDGKFHEEQVQEDEKRTKKIQRFYPNMKVIRWKWHDFDSYQKMKELLSIVK